MVDPRKNLQEAVERQRLNLKELSLELGYNHAYLQQFIARGTPKKLPEDVRNRLAERLGLPPEDLGGSLSTARPSSKTAAAAVSAPSPLPSLVPNASPPVPVDFPNVAIGMYGSAVAGALDDGKFVLNGNRVMDVLCPPMLIGVQGAYGVFVHGNSMKPRYREGEAVFVNPHLPVRQEDYVVVQLAGDFDGDDRSGYIKQFVSRNSRELILAQHQPPEGGDAEPYTENRFLLRFPRDRVIAVHRIVWAGEV